jgi:hypothetical protein
MANSTHARLVIEGETVVMNGEPSLNVVVDTEQVDYGIDVDGPTST